MMSSYSSTPTSVRSVKLFVTVSAVKCSAQYAGNITVGSGSLCAQALQGVNRVRLKGFSIVSGGTAGVVNHFDGTPESGTILFKSRTIGTDNATVSHSVPGEGVLFKDGMTVQYTVATIDMMTFFYA